MAATRDITIDQGANYVLSLTLKLDANTPKDLTGYAASMQVRPGYDGRVVLSGSTEDGKITFPDPTLGQVRVEFVPADTSVIAFRGETLECVYDLEISKAGAVTRVLQGNCTISREVTR